MRSDTSNGLQSEAAVTERKRSARGKVLLESARVAVEALRANWLRAALAVLGVGVGTGVVVTIAAVVTGIRTQVMSAFDSAGPDNFMVMPFDMSDVRASFDGAGRPPWFDKPDISNREVRRIQSLPAVQEAIAGYEFGAALRFESDWLYNVSWRGASPGWPAYTVGDFVSGRDFTFAELDQARAVVVLSEKLAEVLFGHLDPIGKRVRVNAGRRAANELFTVVGVYSVADNYFGEMQDNFAIVPYTAADKRLKARDRWTFMAVQVVPREGEAVEAEHQIVSTLRSMRGLGPGEENNFATIRGEQMVELFNQLTTMFFAVMLGLSSIGMLVGGIGVIGIMLISVTERTREIGVRKALGATRREIMWQFLLEASFLTALGGAAGLLVGWGASSAASALTPLPARIPLWSVGAAIALAAATGIVFGLLPALRASKLDPVDALRYE